MGTCGGDSGGPLTANINGRIVQVGIVSFGAAVGCQRGKIDSLILFDLNQMNIVALRISRCLHARNEIPGLARRKGSRYQLDIELTHFLSLLIRRELS